MPPAPENHLCQTLDSKMHGMQVYLGSSGQNPVKDAVYVGFDIFGILTSGNDWNATLHIPLQAYLHDQHCMPLIAHPASAGHCWALAAQQQKEQEEE